MSANGLLLMSSFCSITAPNSFVAAKPGEANGWSEVLSSLGESLLETSVSGEDRALIRGSADFRAEVAANAVTRGDPNLTSASACSSRLRRTGRIASVVATSRYRSRHGQAENAH